MSNFMWNIELDVLLHINTTLFHKIKMRLAFYKFRNDIMTIKVLQVVHMNCV